MATTTMSFRLAFTPGMVRGSSRESSTYSSVQIGQLMSWPQHIGDLTLPCPLGHFEIATFEPSSFVIESCASSASHFAQVMFTLIPHFSQVYVATAVKPLRLVDERHHGQTRPPAQPVSRGGRAAAIAGGGRHLVVVIPAALSVQIRVSDA